jgi:hypothetical protein
MMRSPREVQQKWLLQSWEAETSKICVMSETKRIERWADNRKRLSSDLQEALIKNIKKTMKQLEGNHLDTRVEKKKRKHHPRDLL